MGGFFKGVGKGLVGAVVKPVVGVTDSVISVAQVVKTLLTKSRGFWGGCYRGLLLLVLGGAAVVGADSIIAAWTFRYVPTRQYDS